MAIAPITLGDTQSRAKINAAIDKANQVDSKADGSALAQEKAAREAGFVAEATARRADILALPLPMPVQHRPGDAPLDFGQSLPEGEAMAEPIAASLLRYDENGRVVRLTGDGVVAPRHLYAVEPGRRYLVTFVVQRRVNSPDPDNDAIRCALAWYGQGKGRLGATPQTIVQDLLSLTTGSGRQVVRAVVSRSAGVEVDIVTPAGARYCRPYVQTFGVSVQSDVEVINWMDITDAVAFAPDVSALEDRVTAVESLDLGARVVDLESQLTAPNEFRVATIGDLEAAMVPVSADAISVLGYYAPGDGGAHRRVAVPIGDPDFDDRASLDGRAWRVAEAIVSPRMTGAMLNWTSVVSPGADDTVAWTRALALGRPIQFPRGKSRITDRLTLQKAGSLRGAGRAASVFCIGSDFNMSATGALKVGSTGDASNAVTDIGFEFYQPDGPSRSDLIQYPPAIDARVAARGIIDRVRVTRGWDGIDTTGNAGGMELGLIEIGAFNRGLIVKGPQDFFHGGFLNFWPYGMLTGDGFANLLNIYKDGTTVGFDADGVISLDVHSLTTYRARVNTRVTGSPSLIGGIGWLALDEARWDHAGGTIAVGSLYCSQEAGRYMVDWSAGVVTVGQIHYLSGLSETLPIIRARGTVDVRMVNARLDLSNSDVPAVEISGAANFAWNGGAIQGVAGKARSVAMIRQIAGHTGRINVRGVMVDARGAGSGDFVEIVADNYHVISDNSAPGWTKTLPVTSPNGLYGSNGGEGSQTWTPAFEFSGMGDLSVNYGARTALFWIEGGMVYFALTMTFTPIFTTATGTARVTGLPFTARSGVNYPVSVSHWSGINTPGTATQMVVGAVAASGSTRMDLFASGDNVNNSQLQPSHFTSGAAVTLNIGGCYRK